MDTLVLKLGATHKSYRLAKLAAKTAHFEGKTQGYSLWFLQFDKF